MAELIYPTNTEMSGIWLLDKAAIKELDEILDTSNKRFDELRTKQIKNQIRREKNRFKNEHDIQDNFWKSKYDKIDEGVKDNWRYKKEPLKVKVFFKSGKSIEADSFSDLIAHPGIEAELPEHASLVVKCGESKIEMTFWHIFNRVEISVSCPDGDDAQYVFGLIYKWVTDYRAPRWHNVWGAWYWFPIPFLFAFAVGFFIKSFEVRETYNEIEKKAASILASDMTDAKRDEAIKIILAYVTKQATPDKESPPYNYKYMIITTVILLFIFLLFLHPRSMLEIGKGRQSITRQRKWLGVIGSAPKWMIGLLVTAVVGLFIQRILEHWRVL